MPAPFLMPLIQLGAGLAQSGLSSWTARRNTERTIEENRAIADYQYSKDLEMYERDNAYKMYLWQLQNEYNSPSSQMQRLSAAGLNPNMVYGTGSVVGNSSQGIQSSQVAKYQGPRVDYNVPPPVNLAVLGQYQDFQLKQAQIDNVKAGTDNVRAKTANEEIRSWLLGLTGEQQRLDIGKTTDTYQYQVDAAAAAAYGMPIQNAKVFQEVQNLGLDRLNKELENKYRQANLDTQQIEQEQKRAQLLFQQYQNQWAKIGVTSADNVMLRLVVRMFSELGLDPGMLFGK